MLLRERKDKPEWKIFALPVPNKRHTKGMQRTEIVKHNTESQCKNGKKKIE